MTERERQKREGKKEEEEQQSQIYQYIHSGYHWMEGIWVSDFIVFFMFFRILKVAQDEHIHFILVSLESRAYGKAYMLKLYWRCLLRKARMRTTDEGREKKKTNTGCWNFKLSQLHNKTQLTAQSLRSSSERPHGAAARYSQPGGREAPLLPAEFLSLYWLKSILLKLPHVQVMLPSSSCSHWKSQGFHRPGPASAQVPPFLLLPGVMHGDSWSAELVAAAEAAAGALWHTTPWIIV